VEGIGMGELEGQNTHEAMSIGGIDDDIAAHQADDTQKRSSQTLAGQQRVNLIWETTQAFIAVLITAAIVTASIITMLTGKGEIPNILCAGFGLVVGTYFQRTNHIKIGGVGYKPPYEER
jgi:hypothetical protein